MSAGPANQASEPFVRLGQQAKAELAKKGLRLVGYSVDHDLDGGPARGRMAVVLDASASSDPDMDAALAGIVDATSSREADERSATALQQLSELSEILRNPNDGILGG